MCVCVYVCVCMCVYMCECLCGCVCVCVCMCVCVRTWFDCQGVCSEDERVLIQLQDVMEFVESKDNLTIDTILARISQSLTQVSWTI